MCTALALSTGATALELELRAGIHTAEIERRSEEVVTGVAVHIASRIAAMADAGQVIVCRTVAELVRGAGLPARDLGERSLCGGQGAIRLYVLTDGNTP